jgi:hypothetical protein
MLPQALETFALHRGKALLYVVIAVSSGRKKARPGPPEMCGLLL